MRLFTRNGHDWSGRFPLITEAALRNRCSSFVLDGEAVLLGVDGSRKYLDDVKAIRGKKIDDWRRREPHMPNVSEAIRRRIEMGLESAKKGGKHRGR